MSMAERADLVARLSLDSRGFSVGIKGASRDLSSLGKLGSKVGSDIGHGVRTASHNIERLAFAGAALAAGGGAAAVKWAADFQSGMNTINSVALTTPAILAKAGEGLRTTFRQTGQSMEDLQAAEYDLVSAGIKLTDAQTGVNTAVKLGIGALGTTSQAVDVLTTAINAYGLKAKDGSVATATWTRLSDELAQAVADGKTKLDAIAGSYAQVAPLAAQYGVSTGEIAAAFGYLTAKGNPAAETATQMSRAILELIKPSADMAKVLKALGLSGRQLISKYGLSGGLEQIRLQAIKSKVPFQDLFGRVEGLRYALQVTGPNAKGFATEMDRMAHSAGMTAKQFDARAQGFNYQLGVLKANVQDAGITIGTALLPKLTEMAQKAADFLRGHQQDVKDFATSLADGFEKAATWAEKLDWGAIAGAVKGIAGFAKGIAEGFMAMPMEAKELLLGLYGLNKLSGGAVVNVGVDITKGIGGGLFQQFFGRGSPANPMWVKSVGGIGGGGGLPGGPAVPGGAAAGALIDTFLAAGLVTAIGAAAMAFFFDYLPETFKTKGPLPTYQTPIGPLTPGTSPTNLIHQGNPNIYNLLNQAKTPVSAPVPVKLASVDEQMFRDQDNAQQAWVKRQLLAADTASERIGTLHSQLQTLNTETTRIANKREENRLTARLTIPITVNNYGHGPEAGSTVRKAVVRQGSIVLAGQMGIS